MKHDKRDGIAVYRNSAGNILYSAEFIDDAIARRAEFTQEKLPIRHRENH